MNFFDLHCDTIFELYHKKKINNLCVNFNQILKFNKYTGCFAIWIPDHLTENQAFEFLASAFNFVKSNKILKKYRNHIKLTVEGTKFIGRDLSKIKLLIKNNVKIVTLTWNGSCRVGGGCFSKNLEGLTEFGEKLVKKLEKNNIIIDVSHSSEKLFYDVCNVAKKPIIATHSNAKAICDHPRNLTDDQFKTISQNNGIIGLTLCDEFISKNGNSNLDNLFGHIEHFLSLSGQNSLCIGTDFDGSKTIKSINNLEKIETLYEYLLKKNYPENLVEKIFFDNANSFFENNNL